VQPEQSLRGEKQQRWGGSLQVCRSTLVYRGRLAIAALGFGYGKGYIQMNTTIKILRTKKLTNVLFIETLTPGVTRCSKNVEIASKF